MPLGQAQNPQNPFGGIFAPSQPTAPTNGGPMGSNVPSASQSGGTGSGTSWWSKMSPEAQGALINAGASIGGGVLTGIGKDKSDKAQMDFNYAQLRQTAADNAAQRTIQAAQSNPLAIQAQRQKMAVMGAILPGLRNVQVSSGIPGMDQFIPHVTGGMRLPENGLPQNVLDFYSPQSVANAEGEFWKQMAGSVVPQDLTKVGYGAAGQAGTDTAMAARQQAVGNAMNPMNTPTSGGQVGQDGQPLHDGSTVDDATMHAYGNAPQGLHWDHNGANSWKLSKDGSGFWHHLAKFGGIAGAGIATALSGGALSPLLAGAIGAGSGAAAGWGGGGGVKGALIGGALGGVGGGFGGHIPGLGMGGGASTPATGVGSVLKQTVLNPQFDAKIAGQVLPGRAGQVANAAGSFLPGPGQQGSVPGDGMQSIISSQRPQPINWAQIVQQIMNAHNQAGQQGQQPQQGGGTNWAQIIQQLLALRNIPNGGVLN